MYAEAVLVCVCVRGHSGSYVDVPVGRIHIWGWFLNTYSINTSIFTVVSDSCALARFRSLARPHTLAPSLSLPPHPSLLHPAPLLSRSSSHCRTTESSREKPRSALPLLQIKAPVGGERSLLKIILMRRRRIHV